MLDPITTKCRCSSEVHDDYNLMFQIITTIKFVK